MANVKTAISLGKELFGRVNDLAGELHVSRSQIFSLAVEEYIRKHENRTLLEQINQAYDDFPDSTERQVQKGMHQHHQSLVKNQWK